MFESIVSLVGNAFGAVKEFFGFQSKRLDLKNTADVKAAAAAQSEATAVDQVEKAVAGKDVNAIRKDLAE
jgi:hypothetical protein